MLLQELQIEGFRSLKSVTWKPGRLNVLIGPNGGGKSNLLRGLDLLRIAADGPLGDAVVEAGGMAPLVWDGQAKKISFSVRCSDGAIPHTELGYELELRRFGNTGGFSVGTERLQQVSLSGGPVVFERQSQERYATLAQKLGAGMLMPVNPAPTETMLSMSQGIPDSSARAFQDQIQRWTVHNDMRVDQEAELRRTAVTRSEKSVRPDGQNLIAVLHTLYTNDRNFEETLDKVMCAAFPDDYDKLIFPPAEHGRTEMRVRRKHRKGTDSPADLSDGTLRFLLLATILGSTHPAPLIAVDEPEAGLHPRMMSIIAEIAADAAMKSQVIFSTHSPQFLDAFRDEPPTVTVVTSNGSETELRTIGGPDLKKWVDDYSLGKFAFSGEAEAVL